MADTPVLEQPPSALTPITGEEWKRWLWRVYATVGENGQGTFPKLQIANATFTNENAFQDLLNSDKGLYVNYSSTVQEIIYGFACNVRRAAGTAYTVGAQINSWAEKGVTGGQWGIATESISMPGSNVFNAGIESSVAVLTDSTQLPKWGLIPVFKNRSDGAAAAASGLGANRYNYFTKGLNFTTQPRSSAGEFCGWNVGIEFGDYWGDQELVPAWNNTTTYQGGQCVSDGGVVWKAITSSLNQVPAGGSAYWVQRTVGTTNNLCVGIDFSSMSLGSMARMQSAIRLRATQMFHWEESGQIGSTFIAATGIMRILENAGTALVSTAVATGNTTVLGTLTAADFIGSIGATTPDDGTFTNLSATSLPFSAWSPTLTFATPGDLAVTYTTQIGGAIKLGQLVIADFNIVTNTFTHTTAAGDLRITALPYTSANVTGYLSTCSMIFAGITKAGYTDFVAYVTSNTTTLLFAAGASASAAANVTAADVPTGGAVRLRGTMIYRTT